MKVIAVFKTHVDIGFTDLPRKILDSYSTHLLSRVVEVCEKTKYFKNPFIWTMPAFVLHYALRNCTPELKFRTEALIKEDRIVWHALPFTLKSEFFSGYELRQTLYYSKELSRIYNKPMPISAKMTDVPGHTQALVDVLCESGIKFLHLGCNPASTPPDVPRLFYWESKNGNRILTYYEKDYGGNVIPPDDWKYPVYLSMNVSADNTGVHNYKTVEKLKSELEAFDTSVEFCIGTMDDFAQELLKCDLSDLPVIKGELGDTWIAGLGAFPEGCAAIGDVRRSFEQLSLFLEEKGDTEFSAIQREYLEKSMFFGEHSGGVDVKKLLSERRAYDKNELLKALKTEPYMYAKSGWDDEIKWCFEARNAALELEKRVSEKYGYVLYPDETAAESNDFNIEFESGNIIITNRANNKIIRLGYLYEVIGRDTIDSYLDNYLTKKVDWSLADFGRYKMDGTNTYPDICDKTFVPVVKEVTRNDDCICVNYSADNESFNTYGNAGQITIGAKAVGNRVQIWVDVVNKQPAMYAEGGYMCFEINEDLKDIAICKSGIEINPERDIVPGANSSFFAADKYIKVNDIRIEPIHTPLVCFGEPKVYRNNTQRFSMPQNGKVFFNLFNNMWASGSPQWISGSYHFEFYISYE